MGKASEHKSTKVVSQDLVMALDRAKISDRQATIVVAATASSLGHEIDNITLSRSSIRRKGMQIREDIANAIKLSFEPNVPLTVHWDGKFILNLLNDVDAERLPIIVSGGGKSKLLAVPKLESGTGENIAKAVIEALDDWGLRNRVRAMCFDTTISNTGEKKGACTIIENELGSKLLRTACRHHILEIIISSVFDKCHNISASGPDILIFKRLKNEWNSFDKNNFETIQVDIPNRIGIIQICLQHLEKKHSRADYQELLSLTVIYLGGTSCKNYKFNKPGALHRARWMARVIYALKICLFHKQMKLTKSEINGMQRFVLYAIQCYVIEWFLAPTASAAPATDFSLLKKLQIYNDKEISEVACKALSRHLWYLNEELIGLSFFDERLSHETKRDMVNSLKRQGSTNPSTRLTIDVTDLSLQEKKLSFFITSTTRNFFTKLEIPMGFLNEDPADWSNNDDYIIG